MTLNQLPMTSPKPTYRWIPWLFVAAMGLVVVVNGALVYFALGTRSAVIGKSPYEEGRHYAERLAERDAQAGQNWQVSAGYVGDLHGGRIDIDLRDAAGKPIDGAQVVVRVGRPVGNLPADRVALQQQGQGHYSAAYTVTSAGQWDLAIDIAGVGLGFASEKRIVVK